MKYRIALAHLWAWLPPPGPDLVPEQQVDDALVAHAGGQVQQRLARHVALVHVEGGVELPRAALVPVRTVELWRNRGTEEDSFVCCSIWHSPLEA